MAQRCRNTVKLRHLSDNVLFNNHSIAEVPQWVYGVLFLVSLGVSIGCSYAGPHGTVLIPAWSIIFFTGLSPLKLFYYINILILLFY
jgi:hypothetical protein